MNITMQVKIDKVWRDIRPSTGPVYTYNTVAEAAKMLEMCYPDQCREARMGRNPVVRLNAPSAYLYPSYKPVDRDKHKLIPEGWEPRLG